MPSIDENEQTIIRADQEIHEWTKDVSDHIPVAVRFVITTDSD
jgi:hypothetical protein